MQKWSFAIRTWKLTKYSLERKRFSNKVVLLILDYDITPCLMRHSRFGISILNYWFQIVMNFFNSKRLRFHKTVRTMRSISELKQIHNSWSSRKSERKLTTIIVSATRFVVIVHAFDIYLYKNNVLDYSKWANWIIELNKENHIAITKHWHLKNVTNKMSQLLFYSMAHTTHI